ncbi:DUF5681 domain-containing protein [Methylocystis sp. WRRC1]|uniref:DUF5681 domain-containing protein n=1 Tax=Methylocystis sp. WRRC1 TaxID=1732014 RepID=UPI001D13C131|nr:DUF5681 domain-containing protein [Methylocystis sp. WRRC1]MCC3246763.1 DUF5681 domain-containing protein [Methylocystis sp. WRRC1]
MADNSTGKQRGKPFEKGKSGNPAGKPKGARHKTTLLAEKLMQDDAENIVNAVLKAAHNGDMTAARIVLDRIAPPRRDNLVRFTLPKIERASDAATASAAILDAVAEGELTPAEAGEIVKLIEGFVKTLELTEIDERLKRLEGKAGI